jgi:hypothetical protein
MRAVLLISDGYDTSAVDDAHEGDANSSNPKNGRTSNVFFDHFMSVSLRMIITCVVFLLPYLMQSRLPLFLVVLIASTP